MVYQMYHIIIPYFAHNSIFNPLISYRTRHWFAWIASPGKMTPVLIRSNAPVDWQLSPDTMLHNEHFHSLNTAQVVIEIQTTCTMLFLSGTLPSGNGGWTPYCGLRTFCLFSSDQEGNERLIVVLQQSLFVLFRPRRQWTPYCGLTTVSLCPLQTKKTMNALLWSYNSLSLSSSDQEGNEHLIVVLQQSLFVLFRPRRQWTPYCGLTTVSLCSLQTKKTMNTLLYSYNSLSLSSSDQEDNEHLIVVLQQSLFVLFRPRRQWTPYCGLTTVSLCSLQTKKTMNTLLYSYNSLSLSSSDQEDNEHLIVVLQQSLFVLFRPRRQWTPYCILTTVSLCSLQTKKTMNTLLWSYNSLSLFSSDQEDNEHLIVFLQQSLFVLFRPRRQWTPYCGLTTVSVCSLQTKKTMNTLLWSYNSLSLFSSDQEDNEHVIVFLQQSLFVLFRPRRQWTPYCGLTTVSVCPLQTKKTMNTLLYSYNSLSLSSSDQEDNEHLIVFLQQSLFVLFRPRRQWTPYCGLTTVSVCPLQTKKTMNTLLYSYNSLSLSSSDQEDNEHLIVVLQQFLFVLFRPRRQWTPYCILTTVSLCPLQTKKTMNTLLWSYNSFCLSSSDQEDNEHLIVFLQQFLFVLFRPRRQWTRYCGLTTVSLCSLQTKKTMNTLLWSYNSFCLSSSDQEDNEHLIVVLQQSLFVLFRPRRQWTPYCGLTTVSVCSLQTKKTMNTLLWSYNSFCLFSSDQEDNEHLIVVLQQSLFVLFRPRRQWTPYCILTTVSLCPLQTKKTMNTLLYSYNSFCLSSSDQEDNEHLIVFLQQSLFVLFRPRRQWTPYCGLTTVSVCSLQTKKTMNTLLWSYNSFCLSSSDQEDNEHLIVVLQQSLFVLFRPRRQWTPYCGLTTVSVCSLQTKKTMNTLLWSYNSFCLSSSDQEDNEHLIVFLQQSLFVLFRPRRQWTPYCILTTVSVCPLQTKKTMNTLLYSYNSLSLSSSDQEDNEHLIVVLQQFLFVLFRPRRQWTPYCGLTTVSVCPLQTKKTMNTLLWSYNSLSLSSSDQEDNEHLIVVLQQFLFVLFRPRRQWTPYCGLTTVSLCPLQTKKTMNTLLWSYNSLSLFSSDQEDNEHLIVVLQQFLFVLFRPRRQWTPYCGLTTVSVCSLQTKKTMNTLLWSYNSFCLSSSDQEDNEHLIVVLQQSLFVLFRPRRQWTPYCGLTTVSVCSLQTKKTMNTLLWSYNSFCLSSSDQEDNEHLIVFLQQSLFVLFRPRRQWTPYCGLTTVSVCPLQTKKTMNTLLWSYNSFCLSSSDQEDNEHLIVFLQQSLFVLFRPRRQWTPYCGLTTVSLCPLQTKKTMNTLLYSYNSLSLSSSDQEDNEHLIVVLQQFLFVLFRPRRQWTPYCGLTTVSVCPLQTKKTMNTLLYSYNTFCLFSSDQEGDGGGSTWAHRSGRHHLLDSQRCQEVLASEGTTHYEWGVEEGTQGLWRDQICQQMTVSWEGQMDR